MNLAHESVFRGKYLRPRRRKSKRWDQSFFVWPKMRRNIVKFCKLCENCQLTARGLVIHRVRITPIPREYGRRWENLIRYRLQVACSLLFMYKLSGFVHQMGNSIPIDIVVCYPRH